MSDRPVMNYAWTTGRDLPEVEDGALLEGFNLAQREPHTKIFPGRKDLVFKDCLLINCDLPAGAVKKDCNHFHVSLCSHLHEKWVRKGLRECLEECEHVTGIDEIVVDGVTVDRVIHYQDKGVI